MKKSIAALGALLLTINEAAAQSQPLGTEGLGNPSALPAELGGMAAIAAVCLILGVQLAKFRKK